MHACSRSLMHSPWGHPMETGRPFSMPSPVQEPTLGLADLSPVPRGSRHLLSPISVASRQVGQAAPAGSWGEQGPCRASTKSGEQAVLAAQHPKPSDCFLRDVSLLPFVPFDASCPTTSSP